VHDGILNQAGQCVFQSAWRNLLILLYGNRIGVCEGVVVCILFHIKTPILDFSATAHALLKQYLVLFEEEK